MGKLSHEELEFVIKKFDEYKKHKPSEKYIATTVDTLNIDNDFFVAEAYIFGDLEQIADQLVEKDPKIQKGKISTENFGLILKKA